MAVPQEKHFITPEEYLRLERAADYKSEYYAGEMFSMAGGSAPHSLISMNAGGELRSILKGNRCAPYDSNLRILFLPMVSTPTRIRRSSAGRSNWCPGTTT